MPLGTNTRNEKLTDVFFRCHPDEPISWLPPCENHERGHAEDFEFGGYHGRLVDIDLHKLDLATKFLRQRSYHWSHYVAWSAPGSPEFHKDRSLGIDHLSIPFSILDRFYQLRLHCKNASPHSI